MRALSLSLIAGTGVVLSVAFFGFIQHNHDDSSYTPSLTVHQHDVKTIAENKVQKQDKEKTWLFSPPVQRKKKPGIPPAVNKSPYVQPPFPQRDIPFENHTVIAGEGGEFSYETGSTVKIPPGAFLHPDGTPVQGEVNVAYREIHTVSDVFLCGIPMKYGDDETFFETAGMLEIRASQNGEELWLDTARPVQIKMASTTDEAGFNLYAYNDASGTWTENEMPLTTTDKTQYSIYETYNLYTGKIGIYHVNIYDADFSFRVGKDRKKAFIRISREGIKQKNNETRHLKHFNFEIEGYTRTSFKRKIKNEFNVKLRQKFSKGNFDDIRIAEDGTGSVDITFKKNYKTLTVKAIPFFEADQKSKNIRKRLDKYTEARAEYNTEDIYEMRAVTNSCYTIDGVDYVVSAGYQAESRIYQEFSIRNFGIWNCDRPSKLPDGVRFCASFQIEGDYKPANVKLVDLKKNALFTYYEYAFNTFKLNPGSSNILLTPVSEETVAYMLPDEVKKLDFNQKKVVIKMETISVDLFLEILDALNPRSRPHKTNQEV